MLRQHAAIAHPAHSTHKSKSELASLPSSSKHKAFTCMSVPSKYVRHALQSACTSNALCQLIHTCLGSNSSKTNVSSLQSDHQGMVLGMVNITHDTCSFREFKRIRKYHLHKACQAAKERTNMTGTTTGSTPYCAAVSSAAGRSVMTSASPVPHTDWQWLHAAVYCTDTTLFMPFPHKSKGGSHSCVSSPGLRGHAKKRDENYSLPVMTNTGGTSAGGGASGVSARTALTWCPSSGLSHRYF